MVELADIRPEDAHLAQNSALMRLHLKFTGDTHRLLGGFVDALTPEILKAAGADGKLGSQRKGAKLAKVTTKLWTHMANEWVERLIAARRAAVFITFGQVAIYHAHYFGALEEELQEQDGGLGTWIGIGWPQVIKDIDSGDDVIEPVFDKYPPAIQAAARRTADLLDMGSSLKYSDGKTLSDRIWQWSAMNHGRIQSALRTGIAEGNSAWNVAKKVEKYVKAGSSCPRWTSQRLALTKTDIAAGDLKGLIRGSACDTGGGVAYAALRMARNEIQIVHHMATDDNTAAMPWIAREYIMLSPSHPPIKCKCETVVETGPYAKYPGLYPKGEIILPIHVQCLCWKKPALMGLTRFTNKARDWMQGKKAWPEMDQYAQWLGYPVTPIKMAPRAPAPAPVVIQPEPVPEPEPVPAPVVDTGFPPDLDELKKIQDLGGSTGAILMEDSKGRRYVLKKGASPDHLREEMLADDLYREMGSNVPRYREYKDKDGRPVKLAEFVEGTELGKLMKSTKPEDQARIKKAMDQIKAGFGADCLLGNWDVAGMNLDNILVDREGNAWRIDNGGSMRYRAQGGLKNDQQWQENGVELWSLRDPKVNAQTAGLFQDLGIDTLMDQVEKIVKKWPDMEALMDSRGVDRDLMFTLQERVDKWKDLSDTHFVMRSDKWKEDYVDGFMGHLAQYRARGISNELPSQLKNTGTRIRDEYDMPFDHLRGRQSLNIKVDAYMKELGGDWATVSRWMSEQGGSSWSPAPKAVKGFFMDQRDVQEREYYLGPGGTTTTPDTLFQRARKLIGEQKMRVSYQAYHAWTYEMLHSVDFARNRRQDGIVELVRTESRDVMSLGGMTRGGARKSYQRGAVESCSIFRTVCVKGAELNMMEVPHHRVIGTYFGERTPGSETSPFMGDGENEFVTMLEGIDSYWREQITSGKATAPMWKEYHKKFP